MEIAAAIFVGAVGIGLGVGLIAMGYAIYKSFKD